MNTQIEVTHITFPGNALGVSLKFYLPGTHGEAHDDCGTFYRIGHHAGSQAHFVRRHVSCFRRDCPICYPDWEKRESKSIQERTEAWQSQNSHRLIIHYVVSPPQDVDYHSKDSYRRLRTKAYRIAQSRGISGGCMIFHERAVRHIDPDDYHELHECSDGPHFHIIGDGWLERTKELYNQDGWIVKNLRWRKSVFNTALYILDHASIPYVMVDSGDSRPGYPALWQSTGSSLTVVTWFGSMSYNKLKVLKIPGPDAILCPICDQLIPRADWFKIYWVGFDPPDMSEKVGWLTPSPPENLEFGVCLVSRWQNMSPGWMGCYFDSDLQFVELEVKKNGNTGSKN